MLLRESLSSNDTPFAKLARLDLPVTTDKSDSPQVTPGGVRPYRKYRKFSVQDLKELTELYEAGESMPKLAEKFECHRQTVARQLKKAGVTLREQHAAVPIFVAGHDQKLKPHLAASTSVAQQRIETPYDGCDDSGA